MNTLQYRARLTENNPKSERPKTTYWTDIGHARDWARSTLAASPDPEAFVSIVELVERNVEIIAKSKPEEPKP